MINAFLYGSTHLLKLWKELRQEIGNCDNINEQLYLVVKFWSLAPLSTRVLDWDNPQNWPDAWQLIHSQLFDESSIALAMFYTLLLSERLDSTQLVLMLIKDQHRQLQRIILKVNNQWFLNLDYNKIVDSHSSPVKLSIQQIYSFDGKIHKIYNQKI